MANTTISGDKSLEAPHRLVLEGRRKLTMTGVVEVESFDESAIQLTTTRGGVCIRGTGLHLQMLSLDGGQVAVDGTVDAITYEDDTPAVGFFARLFG